MTKSSSSSTFHRNIISTILICFFTSCNTRNSFDNLDLSIQTLNPGVTGFKLTGNAEYFGHSVRTAGDIDNDGYDDIIIGAPWKNSYRGVAYVIYGGEESAFSSIDLSTTSLNPLTTGFTIKGNAVSDELGVSVSTAGDIDGDGYDDIVVGAYKKNTAYVIYGGPKATMSNWDFSSSTTLNPTSTGFTITGNAANDFFGWSVSTAGDIDNDGYDDIIVGASNKNSNQGAAYVIYGKAKSSMSNIALSSTPLIPASTGFMLTGNAVGDYFGFSVSTAGDINNDGYADIIIGAPSWSAGNNYGAAYVIYGGAKSSMSNIFVISVAWATVGFYITGNAANDQLGYSVSTAGDINKDGYDDIIIGAPNKNSNQGAAYVIYGGEKPSMSNVVLSSTTLNPTSTGFKITGNAAGDNFGWSVSTAGDIDNDGYADIIIGTYVGNTVYVIYGKAKSSMSNIVLSSTTLDSTSNGFTITGNAANDRFGASVSAAGDINNDGYDDIIIGAKGENAAYVIYASCSANCKQCSSESVCIECKNPYRLYQSKCFASCPDATWADSSTTCQDCSTNCNKCNSASVCTECKDSYILYQDKCLDSCPDEMFLSTTTCEDCISPCSKCTSLTACTECISPLILYNSGCLVSCPKTMFNSNNVCKDCPSYCYTCNSQDSCQVCFEGYTLSNSLCVFPSISDFSYLQAKEKASQVIASAARGISSVVCVGSAVSPLAALVSKIVQNTRYLNLSVTTDLAGVYKTWQTDIISWNVPNVMSNLDHFETSPSLFSQYDLGSPFLVNFWPTLINVVIGFGTFFVCLLVQKIFEHEKYEGWASSLVRKLVAGSFNFALVQAYACLDDILFYLVLDAKTNPFNSFFSWTSMICAVLFLALGCLQVFFNFWTVKKYQRIKPQGTNEIEAFNEGNKYWALFYSDFNDDDLWSQTFFALVIIRSALSSFVITVLYEYPLLQASYLIMIDIAILSFLYLKNPFNTLRGTLAQYYYEIITLLVHICAFILGLQDSFDNPSGTVRNIMSTGILYLNTALISGAIGFMFIEIYKTISEKKRAAGLKKHPSGPEDNQETQNLTQAPLHSSGALTQKRLDSVNQEAIEKFYFVPENYQNRNVTGPDLNIESSQSFNVENSILSDLNSSNRMNPQRSQNPAPDMIRHRSQRQRRNNPRIPSDIINYP